MTSKKQFRFNEFAQGDIYSFERIFTTNDFDIFSSLSGDNNELHYENDYSASSQFKKPIVPLHLVISVFSAFAGRYLPGKPSLYLGHQVTATHPVYYHKKTIYTAKITSVSESNQVLSLTINVIQDLKICVTANVQTQALLEEWEDDASDRQSLLLDRNDRHRYLVVGASSNIGCSLVNYLRQQGHNVYGTYRTPGESSIKLDQMLSGCGPESRSFRLDVLDKNSIREFEDSIDGISIDRLIYLPSTPAKSDISSLVQSNYVAFKCIVESLLPQMLLHQYGHIIFMSSIYIQSLPQDYIDYAAAKSMVSSYLQMLNNAYGLCGVKASAIAPSVVDSPFSDADKLSYKMLPSQVAEEIINILKEDQSVIRVKSHNLVTDLSQYTPTIHTDSSAGSQLSSPSFPQNTKISHSLQDSPIEAELFKIFQKYLRISDMEGALQASQATIPAWDSLAQIMLISAIEAQFNLTIHPDDISSLNSFQNMSRYILQSTIS